MRKGLDEILNHIERNPGQKILVKRCLSLLSEVEDTIDKSEKLLRLAVLIKDSDNQLALKISHEVFSQWRDPLTGEMGRINVEALRVMGEVFTAAGRHAKAAVIQNELRKLEQELSQRSTEPDDMIGVFRNGDEVSIRMRDLVESQLPVRGAKGWPGIMEQPLFASPASPPLPMPIPQHEVTRITKPFASDAQSISPPVMDHPFVAPIDTKGAGPALVEKPADLDQHSLSLPEEGTEGDVADHFILDLATQVHAQPGLHSAPHHHQEPPSHQTVSAQPPAPEPTHIAFEPAPIGWEQTRISIPPETKAVRDLETFQPPLHHDDGLLTKFESDEVSPSFDSSAGSSTGAAKPTLGAGLTQDKSNVANVPEKSRDIRPIGGRKIRIMESKSSHETPAASGTEPRPRGNARASVKEQREPPLTQLAQYVHKSALTAGQWVSDQAARDRLAEESQRGQWTLGLVACETLVTHLHDYPGVGTPPLRAIKALWRELTVPALENLAQLAHLSIPLEELWGQYLDQLLAEGRARDALWEIRRMIHPKSRLPWVRQAWHRLPLLWQRLHVVGFEWQDEDGVSIFCERLRAREGLTYQSLIMIA